MQKEWRNIHWFLAETYSEISLKWSFSKAATSLLQPSTQVTYSIFASLLNSHRSITDASLWPIGVHYKEVSLYVGG